MSTLQGRRDGASPSQDERQRVLEQFHSFPFSSDEAFQQGLAGILDHQPTDQLSDTKKSELVLKIKVFYFNRFTGHNLSLADVQRRYTADLNRFHAESGNETSSGAEHGEMRVLTFAELKSLLEQGKTDEIPNNKVVADILNDGVPSQSTTPLRRKPWELSSQS